MKSEPLTIGAEIRAALKAGKDAPGLVGEEATKRIIAEINGNVCQCGRKKAAGVGFCVKDIQALPVNLYTQFWKSRGGELNAAYAHCLVHLHADIIAKRAKRRAARG